MSNLKRNQIENASERKRAKTIENSQRQSINVYVACTVQYAPIQQYSQKQF